MMEDKNICQQQDDTKIFLLAIVFITILFLVGFVINYVASLKWDLILKIIVGVAFGLMSTALIGLPILLFLFENKTTEEEKETIFSKKEKECLASKAKHLMEKTNKPIYLFIKGKYKWIGTIEEYIALKEMIEIGEVKAYELPFAEGKEVLLKELEKIENELRKK